MVYQFLVPRGPCSSWRFQALDILRAAHLDGCDLGFYHSIRSGDLPSSV